VRRRGSASIAANPVLIGAATTLVVIVAVFLAYNANNGLPFVPTYQLDVLVPNAANLVKGNEVRVGGTRVGLVSTITPVKLSNGRYEAKLGLKLQTSIKPLPVDSTVLIRPRSALGLKYVEITKGTASKGFADGATVPLGNASPRPVEIDQVLNTFDARTRAAAQRNLLEFGNALAGRGADLNTFINEINPTLLNLVPVMRNLSDPATRLPQLFQALERGARIVAPVAQTQADLFVNLDTTFSALSSVRDDIRRSIAGGPAALDAAIKGFPVQRPFLANSEALFRELRPGVHALKKTSGDLADAFEAGTPALKRSVALNTRLASTFLALQRFAEDPLTTLGVKDLHNLADILNPTLADLRPEQTVCNYLTLWFRNVSSLLSEGDTNGTWQRFIVVAAPAGPNNEGGPAQTAANGPGADNYLHTNPLPNTPGGGRPNECEAGNEPWLPGRKVIGNVPGNQGTNHDVTTRNLGQ
jgi:phospholipid/cholesterol/gamma-HCH transport system substrate-binding protein